MSHAPVLPELSTGNVNASGAALVGMPSLAIAFNDVLGWIHFWGWQSIIVAAAITLPMGFTTSKEYAELEWPIKIAIAVVWVAFTVNLIGTILKRREKHMYVAIWFFLATALTVAVLHVTNSMTMPNGSWREGSTNASSAVSKSRCSADSATTAGCSEAARVHSVRREARHWERGAGPFWVSGDAR